MSLLTCIAKWLRLPLVWRQTALNPANTLRMLALKKDFPFKLIWQPLDLELHSVVQKGLWTVTHVWITSNIKAWALSFCRSHQRKSPSRPEQLRWLDAKDAWDSRHRNDNTTSGRNLTEICQAMDFAEESQGHILEYISTEAQQDSLLTEATWSDN